jgi:hypothetical protein
MSDSKPSISKSSRENKHLPRNEHRTDLDSGSLPAMDVTTPPPEERPPWTGEADFQSLQVPDFLSPITKPTAVLKVVVRPPRAQEYVRVRPGAAWRGQYGLLRIRRTGTLYVVMPELHRELADEFGYYVVFTAINRDGEVFLWPVQLSDASGRANGWWESAHEAAQRAETRWVRLRSDQARGRYEIIEAQQGLSEPQWPEKSFGELFALGFKDLVIARLDHPEVQRLRGAL